ncbi:hypothetical protein BGW80DRAFT_1460112 [Lactifluus volemus]|nr:hypothetical protein BGW80DRAFT_1460112 [Lactifluus volemus]
MLAKTPLEVALSPLAVAGLALHTACKVYSKHPSPVLDTSRIADPEAEAFGMTIIRRRISAAHALKCSDEARRRAASMSESLLTWLMEKEPEIVWETDTPHDARTQWAMLCAEVIMRSAPSPSSSSSSTPLLCVFWGSASSRHRTWDWPADVCALVWRMFAERWRALAKGWEEAPVVTVRLPWRGFGSESC